MDSANIIAIVVGVAVIGAGVWKFFQWRTLKELKVVNADQVTADHGRVCVAGRATPFQDETVAAPVSGQQVLYASATRRDERYRSGPQGPSRGPGLSGGGGRSVGRRGGYQSQRRELGTATAGAFAVQGATGGEDAGVRVDLRAVDLGELRPVQVQPHPDFSENRTAVGEFADKIGEVTQALNPDNKSWYEEVQLVPGQDIWVVGTPRPGPDGLELHDETKLYLNPIGSAAQKELTFAGVAVALGVASIVLGILQVFGS